MNIGAIHYASATAPAGYACTRCGAYGCKLWREYNVCADYTELLCCDCAGASQKKDVRQIDAGGRLHSETKRERRRWARQARGPGRRFAKRIAVIKTDQIGWFIPAVPVEEGDAFWGYTSVPENGCAWWRALPTRVARRLS